MTTSPRTGHRPDRSTTPSRRALMRGCAWAAPSALVAIAAPAVAASTPELNGWVQVATTCDSRGRQTLRIDGTGRYPERGIWVDQAPASPAPSAASITYYFPSERPLTWARSSGGSTAWSVPAVDRSAPTISGYLAYTSRFSGTWTYDAATRRQVAAGQPAFQVTSALDSCRTIRSYALRSVTLDETTYSFRRGPVTLQMTSGRSQRSAPAPAAPTDAPTETADGATADGTTTATALV